MRCSPSAPPADAGLALHQSVALGERRLEILEDARITPAERPAMWGGSKAVPGLAGEALRHAGLRLVDRDGRVLDRRRFDCELAEIAEPPLPQGAGAVWGVGDDCSTGEGDFAGLITRFLAVAGDRLAFETYRDPATGEHGELTLVSAKRIMWHLVAKGRAEAVHEVSCHPDFDSPEFKRAGDGTPPADLPWVVDYLTFRWDGKGEWIKSVRTERNARWQASDPWPDDAKFPVAEPSL